MENEIRKSFNNYIHENSQLKRLFDDLSEEDGIMLQVFIEGFAKTVLEQRLQAGQHETIVKRKIPPIPKPPPPRFRTEGMKPACICRSSVKRKWGFLWIIGCIQPNCKNYYKGFPNNDMDDRYSTYT